MNLKMSNLEAAKFWAVVANSHGLSCQGENVLQKIGLDFVIILCVKVINGFSILTQ